MEGMLESNETIYVYVRSVGGGARIADPWGSGPRVGDHAWEVRWRRAGLLSRRNMAGQRDPASAGAHRPTYNENGQAT